MTYYIYKITNLINSKIYIGKTNNLKIRWSKHIWTAKKSSDHPHKYPIHHAISKYGKENFTYEKIDEAETEQQILQKEIFWIKTFKDQNYILYNITDGGEGVVGYIPTKETRQKISQANKGKFVGNNNPMFEKGYTILGENNPFYGHHHSIESRTKMSNKRQGSKNPRAQLNEDLVKEIRANINNLTVKELSNKYGVKTITIYKILYNKIWKNLI